MVVFASEDVGIADTHALGIAVDAFRALEFVGLPEANFALTHATIALALAPKSDTVKRALIAGSANVREGPHAEVPSHLRSGATEGDRTFGHGVGYRSPHAETAGVVAQQYLPDGVEREILVRLKPIGDESELAERLGRIDRILGKPTRDH
jgi:putative ATPase